jgi:hypothetical protein
MTRRIIAAVIVRDVAGSTTYQVRCDGRLATEVTEVTEVTEKSFSKCKVTLNA